MNFASYTPHQCFTTREAITKQIILLAVKSANFRNFAQYDDHNGNICCDVREHHEDGMTKDLWDLIEDYTTFVVQSPCSPDIDEINAVWLKYHALRTMLLL